MLDTWSTGYTGVYKNWTITFTIPASGGGGTVAWSTSVADPSFTGTNAGGTFTVTPTQTTTYTLTATGGNGCVVAASTTVTVAQAVTANAGLDQPICNSPTGAFTLAGNTPTTGTGVWSVVNGTASITSPTSPISGVTGVPIGSSATLRWTITNPPCGNSSDDVVLSNALPPAITPPSAICVGGTVSLIATATCPPTTPTSTSTIYANAGANGSTPNWSNTGNITTANSAYATNTLAANATSGTPRTYHYDTR